MYLKSLELSGFKSFAKKTVLDFNSPITAIVGPNGSGKSNVAEAFQFVLGEQSIKSLRGKRGEDMIFNGSKTTARQNRASVKVTLDNSKRFLSIDFDEVVIERVVHRDNNNEYLINGTPVRLKDIIEVLSQAHMGPTGHHIISQGEADRILNANLKERRLIIEDALGLKVYQYKRQESERKLERTRENIEQVQSLRRELAPHVRFLRKQVEKIEKAEEVKRELVAAYQEYLKRENEYLSHERHALDREYKTPRHELEKLEHELAKVKNTLEKSKERDNKSEQVLVFERSLRDLRARRDEYMRDAGRIEGELSGEERRLKKLRDTADTHTHRMVPLTEIKQWIQDIEVQVAKALAADELVLVRSLLFSVKTALTSFVKHFESQGDAGVVSEVEAEIRRLQGEKSTLEMQMKELDREVREVEATYNHLRTDIEKGKDESREAEREIFRIMTLQNELRAGLALLKAREDTLRLEAEEYERELKEASVLGGLEATHFKDVKIPENVKNEPRSVQQDRRRHLEKLKIRFEELGGAGSEEIMKECKDAEERELFLAREVEDLEKSANVLQAIITELTEKLDFEFKEGVRHINAQFQEFFRLMFGGGEARLLVVKEKKRRRSDVEELLETGEVGGVEEDEDEETEEGIEISVSLPHKKIRGLEVLSGGERALTSIALLFAISQVNPPPFIVLDETDAALDEANSRKYGDMITNLSKYSQLVLITHNRETMSRAGVLYGVTMGQDGVSKILSIQFEEAVQVAK